MNFFQQASANPNATAETLQKERISWNKGLKGCFSDETRQRISQVLKNHQHRQAVYADEGYRNRQRDILKNSEAARVARLASRAKAEETKRKNGYYDRFTKIQTPNSVFNSVEAIMNASGRSLRTVRYWFKKYPKHYYYITKAAE